MEHGGEIPVVYENGVFRPESPLDLPEHSRHLVSIRQVPGAAQNGHPATGADLGAVFEALRSRGLIRAGGWRPSRDELHERD
jgi:hypothetical protein